MTDPTIFSGLAESGIHSLIAGLFVALVGLAAACDVDSFRIPNRISTSLAALYPAHVAATGDLAGVHGALAVATAVLASGFALFAFGLIGGGDVKLLAALALWAGPAHVLELIFVTVLAGGVLAMVLATPAARALAMTAGYETLALRPHMPYGVAIAVAALAVAAPV